MSDGSVAAGPPAEIPQADPAPTARVGTEYLLSGNLVVQTQPKSPAAEAIRALRTHLLAQHIQLGRRALAVCGASAGVGCSFIAANLAASFAQAGLKALLIDGNLRSPGLESYIIPVQTPSGLAQYLASPDTHAGPAIEEEVLPNLSVLYAGGRVSNPQELLAGQGFTSLMDLCLRDFDITIVDTPPSNICADARRISTVLGYSLLVARKDRSLVDDVKTLGRELMSDRAQVIGTVLNEF